MADLPIAVLGPLVSILLQAIKATGLPTKYMPLANILISLAISVWAMWGTIEALPLLINFGTLALATAGTYDLARQGANNEPAKK